MKNKYARRSRIPVAKTRQIVRCFAADLTALQTAQLTGVNRNTINRYYAALRDRILCNCENQKEHFGVAEQSDASANRAKGSGPVVRTGRRNAIVFGIFEREGQVYTEVVPERLKPTLNAMFRGEITPESVVNSSEWRGYDGVVNLGLGHIRIGTNGEGLDGCFSHINGIEGFWGLAKVRFVKFKGIPKHTFHLHLKECEWRYNHRGTDKYKTLLSYLRNDPVS